MPLHNDKLPENALVNVREELKLFFGGGANINPDVSDMLIDWAVKRLHRRWHPSTHLTYEDTTIPAGTGIRNVPADFKKLFNITSQTNDPDDKLSYARGVHYTFVYDKDAAIWQIHWIDPDDTDALSVRVHYIRTPTRAVEDSDLVDVLPDAIDLVKKIARMEYCILKGNLEEYDRLSPAVRKEIQEYVDDDTHLDLADRMQPYTSDGIALDFEDGEIDTE